MPLKLFALVIIYYCALILIHTQIEIHMKLTKQEYIKEKLHLPSWQLEFLRRWSEIYPKVIFIAKLYLIHYFHFILVLFLCGRQTRYMAKAI